ncbi:MAG: hypothetical protein ACI37T_03250 [Candidatus Gastranaerophilaceae bacterium]
MINLFKRAKLILKAGIKRKKYDNIIPLGYNCEIAYRFYRHFRFIESSLFAWVYINSFEELLNALKNLDSLAQGELFYENTMFKCLNSGIYFHGKTSAEKITGDKENASKLIASDIEELRPRIKYLSDKLIKTINNGKSTLFIKKISPKEAIEPDMHDKISELYAFLEKFSKNKFDLLLITEKSFYNDFLYNEQNIYTRNVEQYSPDSTVTDKKSGDKFGWDVIFTEFCPKKRVWKKKKLKFEEI